MTLVLWTVLAQAKVPEFVEKLEKSLYSYDSVKSIRGRLRWRTGYDYSAESSKINLKGAEFQAVWTRDTDWRAKLLTPRFEISKEETELLGEFAAGRLIEAWENPIPGMRDLFQTKGIRCEADDRRMKLVLPDSESAFWTRYLVTLSQDGLTLDVRAEGDGIMSLETRYVFQSFGGKLVPVGQSQDETRDVWRGIRLRVSYQEISGVPVPRTVLCVEEDASSKEQPHVVTELELVDVVVEKK